MGQGLSLRVLADRLGVSPSLISQVETGRAKPSVSTLYAMTAELGISVDDLLFPDASSGRGNNPDGNVATSIVRPPFESAVAPAPLPIRSLPFADEVSEAISAAPDAMPPIPVQPAASRKAIRLASGVVWERLTTTSIPGVEFLYVTYEVGGASTHEHEFQRHAGQEWGYVISGTLGVTVGFEDYALGPGDAISFDSMTPHRMRNLGKEPVHGIWFQLGRPGVHLSGPAAAPRPAGDADRHKR